MSDAKQVAKVTEKKGVSRPAPRAKRAGEGKQPVRLYVKGVHLGYKRFVFPSLPCCAFLLRAPSLVVCFSSQWECS
jgi:hypothetical protein